MEIDITRIKIELDEIFNNDELVGNLLKNFKRYGRYLKSEVHYTYVIFDLDYNLIEAKGDDSPEETMEDCDFEL